MEDCSKRAEALCELNLKGFAPESRVNAIKSAVGIVCLAVVTVALLAWMDFAQPKESAGQEESLSNVFRGWGLGCSNGEFREFIVTMALAAVPVGLTIAGMTWGESVRKVRYFMSNGFKMLLILYEEKRLPGLFYF